MRISFLFVLLMSGCATNCRPDTLSVAPVVSDSQDDPIPFTVVLEIEEFDDHVELIVVSSEPIKSKLEFYANGDKIDIGSSSNRDRVVYELSRTTLSREPRTMVQILVAPTDSYEVGHRSFRVSFDQNGEVTHRSDRPRYY